MDAPTLLFTVEHFRLAGSGAENDAVNLCRELSARGYDVHVAAETAEHVAGVTVHTGLQQFDETRRRVNPDLLVDWGFFQPAHIHRLGGGIHEPFLRYSLEACPRGLRWLRQLTHLKRKHRVEIRREAAMLRNPEARFLAISQFVANQAVAAGASPDAVTVIHNGVDVTRFDPERTEEHRARIRREWGVSDDDTVFLFVAHNLRLKNLQLLRRAFGAVQQQHSHVKLVVVGKRRPRFHAAYLVYAETTPEIERFYTAADALLHPSYFDSFGNVVLEAMSCARAVVVSDRCGVSELVRDGEDGMVIPVCAAPNVLQRWTDAIVKLAENPALRGQLGESARHTAGKHSYERYIDRIEEHIRDTLELRRS